MAREGPELLDFSVDEVAEQLTLMDVVRPGWDAVTGRVPQSTDPTHPPPPPNKHLGDADPLLQPLRPLWGGQALRSEHRAQHATDHHVELGHGGSHSGGSTCGPWTVSL